MTKDQINLIENSWDFVVLNTNEAGMIFYNKLFELDPSLQPLFKNNLSDQARKLVSMITFIVHKLNNLDAVKADIIALGQRHSKYKVKTSHYETVGKALLQTLEIALQDQWNEEMKSAWVTVYTILSNAMIDAMKQVDVEA